MRHLTALTAHAHKSLGSLKELHKNKKEGGMPGAGLVSLLVKTQVKMPKYITRQINKPELADCDAKLVYNQQ